MIRDHEFNSRWWGGRVGILDDPAFFSRPEADRRQMLAPYRWVEFRRSVEKVDDPWLVSRADFAQVDTQLRFRIGLKRLPPRPDADSPLPVLFAND